MAVTRFANTERSPKNSPCSNSHQLTSAVVFDELMLLFKYLRAAVVPFQPSPCPCYLPPLLFFCPTPPRCWERESPFFPIISYFIFFIPNSTLTFPAFLLLGLRKPCSFFFHNPGSTGYVGNFLEHFSHSRTARPTMRVFCVIITQESTTCYIRRISKPTQLLKYKWKKKKHTRQKLHTSL